MEDRKYMLKNYNFKLLFLVMAAIALGTLTILSVDITYMTKQLIGVGLCITALIVVSLIDYNFICKYYMILYGINLVLLILVKLIGFGADTSYGASRWIYIGGLTLQPSEFSKIIMIVCVAVFLDKHHDELNTFKCLMKLAAFIAVPAALIFIEPDLSTTLCLLFTLFIVIFVGGLSLKLIGIMVLILVPSLAGFYGIFSRITCLSFLTTT